MKQSDEVSSRGEFDMANLQIKGIEDRLYEEIKRMAAEEHRSMSQQVLFVVKEYPAKKHQIGRLKALPVGFQVFELYRREPAMLLT